MRRLGLPLGALSALLLLEHSCTSKEGCLGGDDGQCVPASACTPLAYACAAPSVAIHRLASSAERPPGLKAAAAQNDIVLRNDLLTAVLDDIASPHILAPSGGTIIDLVPNGASGNDPGKAPTGDSLNQIFQAVGILPHDAARYTKVDLLDESPRWVAAVFRGKLDSRPEVDIVTRYELRSCEPGLRIRTEIYQGGRDPLTVFATDGFFWGDRGITPFVPVLGGGYLHPDLDLASIGDSFRDAAFLSGDPHTADGSAYAIVPCGRGLLSGFQSGTLSAVGAPRTVLMPGDSLAFERFITVAQGPGQQRAVNTALDARSQLFSERYTTVTGRTTDDAANPVGGDERTASLLFYQPGTGSDPDDPAGRTPWAEAVPDADGRFEVRLPSGGAFRVETYVLGRPIAEHRALLAAGLAMDLGDLHVPLTGMVDATVLGPAGAPLVSEIVLVPALPTAADSVRGSVFGAFDEEHCAPFLGPPHGASPGCNRVMVGPSGTVTFRAPPGSYFAYATHGPFFTLSRQNLEVRAGETANLAFGLSPLQLLPNGVLSGDFHVHGGASFDSTLPDRDRALSFVATGVDVIAATDHDVVTTYGRIIQDLGIADQIVVMPGVETTGQILFLAAPGSSIPKVIGHFNFWPLHYAADLPRNGALNDERLEPGALFDRMQSLYSGTGVAQLNHPYGDSSLGRDTGYLKAIGYDPRVAIPTTPNDSSAGQLPRRPAGGRSNLDFDAQEVMNGASVQQFLKYRTGWFSFLNQGILRAGTANSDSHTLSVEVLGYPRNLVFGGHHLASFDIERFNQSVRRGEMVGTNGPVLIVCLTDDTSVCHGPSHDAVVPTPTAKLAVEVRAAPWIPIEEVRYYVNGELSLTTPIDPKLPADPFASDGLVRYTGAVKLSELLALAKVDGDAFLVVEAGMKLPLVADLDNDGLPDTTDNNGDGVVDERDGAGTFHQPGRVTEDDPRFHVQAVGPGVLPTAFANPIFIDVDGNGWKAKNQR